MSENSAITLPELSGEAIARIENAVFDEIGDEHPPARARSAARGRRRRRRWGAVLGVAAAFVGGILIAPPLLSAVGGGASMPHGATADRAVSGASMTSSDFSMRDGGADLSAAESAPISIDGQLRTDADAAVRDIITVADLTLRVTDIDSAADSVRAIAAEHRGYVEHANIGTTGPDAPEQLARSTRGTISIRIPAGDLDDVLTALEEHGEVLSSSISREDVTSTAVDLRARVAAGEASVQRLTELMAKSGSVADLISAEEALSSRQAQLESYQQQLKSLDERVAMSTVTVALTRQASATQADPAGFGDGLLAGWNGLVVALNALVVAVGFLLPWLGIAAVVVLAIWLARRARRRSRDA